MPFEVPHGWKWVELGKLAIDSADGPFGSNLKKDHYTTNKEVRIIQLSNIGEDGWKDENTKYTTFEHLAAISRSEVKSGDIVIAKMMPAGRAILCPDSDLKYVLSSDAVKFVLPEGICNKYVLNAINSAVFREQVYDNVQGVTRVRTSLQKLRTYLLPIPPLAEQYRIVTSIEQWISFIDSIESSTTDLLQSVQSAKSKILDLAIHGKLVPQDDHDEPASELLKRINPKAVSSCDNPHYEQIPDGWCVCTLEDIIDYEQPQAYIVHSIDYSDSYKIPVLTAGKSFIIGYTNEQDDICDNVPVIIFDDFTTDSKYVDFPFKVKSSAMKILHVKDGINIKYVAYFMSITRLIGNTHKRYWISEYSKVNIPLPPKAEQDRIVNQIERLMCSLDSIAETLV